MGLRPITTSPHAIHLAATAAEIRDLAATDPRAVILGVRAAHDLADYLRRLTRGRTYHTPLSLSQVWPMEATPIPTGRKSGQPRPRTALVNQAMACGHESYGDLTSI